MLKILLIAGTRPEIIKLAPVFIAAKNRKYRNKIKIEFCYTGQHKKMAEDALSIFNIKPDINLSIMKVGQTIDHVASEIFKKLPKIFKKVNPDVVLVQGDTTTAAMSAICTFQNKIPVGHIEAGLRSFDINSPFPEEFNRLAISRIAKYNFCPTKNSNQNLISEGVDKKSLFITGNTVVDALKIVTKKNKLNQLDKIHLKIKKPFVLITAHRRESFGKGFKNICIAIKKSAIKFPNIQFIYPVHLNPNVQKPVHEILGNNSNILLLQPVNYLELLTLLKNSLFVLTDSGGIQEEAPSFNKYCIVMRDVTERTESIKLGNSELVGTNKDKMCKAIEKQINNPSNKKFINPFGDGFAAEKILDILSR